MTESEAIERIRDHFEVHHHDGRPHPYLDEAVEMAIKALEKQIPQKPVERIGTIAIVRKSNGDASYRVYYDCPTCGEEYMERDKPCWNCRQNLDWSKYKEVEWIRSGEE